MGCTSSTSSPHPILQKEDDSSSYFTDLAAANNNGGSSSDKIDFTTKRPTRAPVLERKSPSSSDQKKFNFLLPANTQSSLSPPPLSPLPFSSTMTNGLPSPAADHMSFTIQPLPGIIFYTERPITNKEEDEGNNMTQRKQQDISDNMSVYESVVNDPNYTTLRQLISLIHCLGLQDYEAALTKHFHDTPVDINDRQSLINPTPSKGGGDGVNIDSSTTIPLRPQSTKQISAPPPVMVGYLRKRGHRFPYNWDRRYVVLNNGYLTTYRRPTTDPNSSPYGIDMRGMLCLAGYRIGNKDMNEEHMDEINTRIVEEAEARESINMTSAKTAAASITSTTIASKNKVVTFSKEGGYFYSSPLYSIDLQLQPHSLDEKVEERLHQILHTNAGSEALLVSHFYIEAPTLAERFAWTSALEAHIHYIEEVAQYGIFPQPFKFNASLVHSDDPSQTTANRDTINARDINGENRSNSDNKLLAAGSIRDVRLTLSTSLETQLSSSSGGSGGSGSGSNGTVVKSAVDVLRRILRDQEEVVFHSPTHRRGLLSTVTKSHDDWIKDDTTATTTTTAISDYELVFVQPRVNESYNSPTMEQNEEEEEEDSKEDTERPDAIHRYCDSTMRSTRVATIASSASKKERGFRYSSFSSTLTGGGGGGGGGSYLSKYPKRLLYVHRESKEVHGQFVWLDAHHSDNPFVVKNQLHGIRLGICSNASNNCI
eukprot:scaffold138_cov178-Ochromonas_danica.AAC.8